LGAAEIDSFAGLLVFLERTETSDLYSDSSLLLTALVSTGQASALRESELGQMKLGSVRTGVMIQTDWQDNG
jgi:hypothetical protein